MLILFFTNFQNDVEIPIPKYFINEKLESLKEREKLLGQILTKIGPQDKDDVSTAVLNKPRCEKTGLRGFRPGLTQYGLYSHRRCTEA